MRRNQRYILDKMNKEILIVSLIFIVFVAIGACINKFDSQAQNSIATNISGARDYYNSAISLKNTLIPNLKVDILFLGSMAICTLSIVLIPIALLIFILKGVAIGYTINSVILGLKINSIKIVLITLAKSIIILPGILILAILSAKYIIEIIAEIKKNNKSKIIFLGKRYALNSLIIVIVTVSLQFIINAISIATLQILF